MKKLELALTQAWQKNAAWLKLLTPLSGLYGVVTHARKSCITQVNAQFIGRLYLFLLLVISLLVAVAKRHSLLL